MELVALSLYSLGLTELGLTVGPSPVQVTKQNA